MKSKKILFVSLFLMIAVLAISTFTSVIKISHTTTAVTQTASVSITNTPTSMKVGQTYQMKASVSGVTWESGDTKVATVDKNGKVTAVGGGTALIVVYLTDRETIFDYVTFDVKGKLNPSSVKITNAPSKIKVGSSYYLTATVLPTNLANKSVVWHSDDSTVATVDSNGKVTAKKSGRVLITAWSKVDELIFDYVAIDIDGGPKPTGVIITNVPSSMKIGTSATLKATVSPSGVYNKTVTWKSSDTRIATVDSTGKVVAKSAGMVNIIAYSNQDKSIYRSVSIKVLAPVNVDSVAIKNVPKSMKVGEKFKLEGVVFPTNLPNRTVKWSSQDTKIATVDQNGVVTAIGNGTAIIVATSSYDNNIYQYARITVRGNPPVSSVKITGDTSNMKINSRRQLTAIVSPSTAVNKSVSWVSSNPTILSVDQKGVITSKNRTGTVTILVYSVTNGVHDEVRINVGNGSNPNPPQDNPTKPLAIMIKNNPEIMNVNDTAKLTAEILPSSVKNAYLSWSSSNNNVISIDRDGNIKALNQGKATITVSIAGTKISNKVDILVTKKDNSRRVTIKNAPYSMIISNNYQLETNIGKSSDIKWSSSDDSVIEVDKNGKLKSKKYGKATISATIDGNTTSITVESIELFLEKYRALMTEGETINVNAIIKSSPSFDVKKIESEYSWKTYSDAQIKISNQKNMTKTVTEDSRSINYHYFTAEVYAKKEGTAELLFLADTNIKTFDLIILSKKENLTLQCPDITYKENFITVNNTSDIVSWDYYITKGKTGSGATDNWKKVNTYYKNVTVSYPSTVTQAKIVINAKNGSSRSCYTVPYKNNVDFSKQNSKITRASISCPTITSKATKLSGTKRRIDKIGYIWNTGVSQFNISNNVENNSNGLKSKYQYTWFISTAENEDLFNRYDKTINTNSNLNINTYKNGVDVKMKLVVMDSNGDVNICGSTEVYSALDLNKKEVIDGTNIYFEKGFVNSDRFINFYKSLPKEYKYGTSFLLYLTSKSYGEVIKSGNAVAWGSNIAAHDGEGDYNKYTIVHESGHTMDGLYNYSKNYKGGISDQKDTINLFDNLKVKKKTCSTCCDNFENLRGYSFSDRAEFWADIVKYSYMKEKAPNSDVICNTNNDIINIRNKYINEIKKMSKESSEYRSTNGKEV